MYTNEETTVVPFVRKRPMWPWLAGGVVLLSGVAVAGTMLLSSSVPQPSAACQRAAAAQNQFVAESVALGYPDVPVAQGIQIISSDVALLNAMKDAGCPASMQINVLPGG